MPLKNVTLRQLRVFEAVARRLSFSRAAEELHLTQPAVSMQIKQLEEAAGLPLFERIGKKVYLTEAGGELARRARLVAQQLREADEALAALRGVRGGRLNIAVVSTAKYVAPSLIALFRQRHPAVKLKLGVHNRQMVLRQLQENEVDLAIMGLPPQELPAVAQAFAKHPHIIVAAPVHPLAKKRRIRPAQLADEEFLIRESGSGTRGAMERFFAAHGVTVKGMLEMSSNETIKQATMASMGIAFLSAHTVGLELSIGRLVKLDVVGLPVIRQWHVVHLENKRLSPAAEAFREFLLKEGAKLIRQALRQPSL